MVLPHRRARGVYILPLLYPQPTARPAPMTHLDISNTSRHPVLTYLTLGATPGCVQDVGALTLSDGIVLTPLFPLMGCFTLPAGATTRVGGLNGLGLNGNLCFGTPPLNCPCVEWQEGVCLAEFIINNGFQPGGQETVDISCVCGANAYLKITLSAPDWTTNGGAIQVSSIANATRYQNTGLIGVFPWGCDNCVSSDNPPECVGKQPDQANALPICNVQRPAAGNAGGAVHVSFEGFTPVPM